MWIPQMSRAMDMAHIACAIGALLFILVFGGTGFFLLHKALRNAKTKLSITSDGLSYGAKVYRWDDITEIGLMRKYTGRKDLYCTTRFHPFTVELLLPHGLSSDQIAGLFAALRSELATAHPHVRLIGEGDAGPDC
jgi:hypothetical protein